MAGDRPWYRRPWGIAVLVYLAVTAVLGVTFLIVGRRAALPIDPSATLRIGGFTAHDAAAVPRVIPPGVTILADDDPAIGAPPDRAVLTAVEFSDFECPFCRQAFPIIRALATQFGDRGFRYVYKDAISESIHPNARAAAEAAACAHAAGKFWAYHDQLFLNQPAFSAEQLRRYARQVGLDEQFDRCVASGASRAAVQRNLDLAVALGIRGTPTWFFILGGDERTARRVEGVIPQDAFTALIERELAARPRR